MVEKNPNSNLLRASQNLLQNFTFSMPYNCGLKMKSRVNYTFHFEKSSKYVSQVARSYQNLQSPSKGMKE